MNNNSLRSLLAACCVAACTVACAQQATDHPLYLAGPQIPVDQRVDSLIASMTLEEKASQLGNAAPAIPRLHVPRYNWWNEGLHGVARAGVATVFPQAIGMAATFDAPLVHQVADVISTEFRAKYSQAVEPDGSTQWYYGLTVWSPNINIFRDPRWGRGQETYGEDPYLTARLGVAFVTGLQGDDPQYLKTVATPKHFAVHSGPESTRHTVDVHASRHDMEDTYLPAFRATVVEAKAQSVMCAYNSLNGQPACANTDLLQEHLRDDWGFRGYVVSDCGAIADVFNWPHYATTPEEGVTAAFEAGTDLICGDYRRNMTTEPDAIVSAVHGGSLPQTVIDRALHRLFNIRFRLGLFDPAASVPYARLSAADNDTEAHRQLALRVARESIVLLKNRDHLLPLKAAPKSIAVIGPNADSLDALLGNYHGTPSKPVTVLAGIRQRFPRAKIRYVEGTGLIGPASAPSQDARQALDAARAADLVILVLGLSANVEGEEMKVDAAGFAGGDRTSIDLPAPQQQLLEHIQALGKPTVLVLMNGSALAINWADTHVGAIIDAWYPGEEGGTALAEALAGDFSPAGRLPVTFYRSADQLPAFDDYSMIGRTYRYFDGEALYPFGYGLSYTTFRYANARADSSEISATQPVTISAEVTNAGAVASDEVVQLYLSRPDVAGAPRRALRGFSRIHLERGQTQTVQFVLRDRDLDVVDADGRHRIVAGNVEIWVGGGQPVARADLAAAAGAQTHFTITSSATLPD
jgi:beta-glucosidase